MHGDRFDSITRMFAYGTSRRNIVWGATRSIIAPGISSLGFSGVAQAKPGPVTALPVRPVIDRNQATPTPECPSCGDCESCSADLVCTDSCSTSCAAHELCQRARVSAEFQAIVTELTQRGYEQSTEPQTMETFAEDGTPVTVLSYVFTHTASNETLGAYYLEISNERPAVFAVSTSATSTAIGLVVNDNGTVQDAPLDTFPFVDIPAPVASVRAYLQDESGIAGLPWSDAGCVMCYSVCEGSAEDVVAFAVEEAVCGTTVGEGLDLVELGWKLARRQAVALDVCWWSFIRGFAGLRGPAGVAACMLALNVAKGAVCDFYLKHGGGKLKETLCGFCAAPCPETCGAKCMEFGCIHDCPPEQVCCTDGCADLTSDADHCGDCDLSCGPGFHCESSLCVEQPAMEAGTPGRTGAQPGPAPKGRPGILWTFDSAPTNPMPNGFGYGAAIARDGVVYVGYQSGDSSPSALFAHSGDQIWVVHNTSLAAPLLFENTVYYSGSGALIYAIERQTGDIRWTASTDGIESFTGNLGWGDGTLIALVEYGSYYTETVGRLIAFDPKSGERHWVYDLADSAWNVLPAVANNLVYAYSTNRITAVDLATGGLSWELDMLDWITGMVVTDKRMYVSVRKSSDINVLDPATGKILDLLSTPYGGSILGFQGGVLILNSEAGLSAVTTKDGEGLWLHAGYWSQFPCALVDGQVIVAGQMTDQNYAVTSVNLRTGKVRWSVELPAGPYGVRTSESITVADGQVYVVLDDGSVLAIG